MIVGDSFYLINAKMSLHFKCTFPAILRVISRISETIQHSLTDDKKKSQLSMPNLQAWEDYKILLLFVEITVNHYAKISDFSLMFYEYNWFCHYHPLHLSSDTKTISSTIMNVSGRNTQTLSDTIYLFSTIILYIYGYI